MLRWITSDDYIKGPREWHATAGDGAYSIKGTMWKKVPGTRNIVEYYAVSHSRPAGGGLSVASEQIGEALTLKEARALAQHHWGAAIRRP
jgi:hypothetical protein